MWGLPRHYIEVWIDTESEPLHDITFYPDKDLVSLSTQEGKDLMVGNDTEVDVILYRPLELYTLDDMEILLTKKKVYFSSEGETCSVVQSFPELSFKEMLVNGDLDLISLEDFILNYSRSGQYALGLKVGRQKPMKVTDLKNILESL